MRDVVGGDPLGRASLGLTLSECLGPFRALCRRARQTPQEDNRVGPAAALGAKALVSGARDSGRRRSRLRFLEAPRSLPQAEKADHLRHPSAAGRRTLRECPTAPSWTDRKTSPQGRARARGRRPTAAPGHAGSVVVLEARPRL